MINSTSARILEVLRNVPSVLFMKITLLSVSEFVIFIECHLTRGVIPMYFRMMKPLKNHISLISCVNINSNINSNITSLMFA